MKKVLQDIAHGGNNNDTFINNTLTFYDGQKITSVEGTAVDDNLHIDDLDVDKLTAAQTIISKLEVNGDTVLNGNLTVKGTHTEEHSQDLYVGSNTITLRDGATTALEKYAGLVIEKVDGNNAIGLVTTNDGTLKVGYLNLIYVYTTLDESSEKFGKYYSDVDLTNEVTPKGQVFIESKDDKLAKGYYVDKDETQVIATRDDSADISDKAILYFDKTAYKLVDSGVTSTQLNDLVDRLSTLEGDDKIIIDVKDDSDGTSIKLKNDNKIYTYDTITAAEADLENIPDKAIVHVLGDLNSNSIAIVDEVKEGDYNVPTSDALFNYLKNYSESINGTFTINEWSLVYDD